MPYRFVRNSYPMPCWVFAIAFFTAASCACTGSSVSPTVPTVQGFWKGSWMSTGCSGSAFEEIHFCQPAGSLYLRLTQSGTAVHGFISMCGSEADNVSGHLAANGLLLLSGSGKVPNMDPLIISAWNSSVVGSTMTGTFSCTRTIAGVSDMTITGSLNVTLSSSDPNIPF
jgi:hypothetical protein